MTISSDGYSPLKTEGDEATDNGATDNGAADNGNIPLNDYTDKTEASVNTSGVSSVRGRHESTDSIDLSSDEEADVSLNLDGSKVTIDGIGDLSHSGAKIAALKMKSEQWRKPKRSSTRNMSFSGPTMSLKESHLCSRLYHTKRRVFPLKNYHDEARAMKDIDKFLEQPIVLFKVHHTSWDEIVMEMMIALDKEKPELKLNINSCVKHLVSKDADYMIPECIQGIRESPIGPITEQSFITVVANTNSLNECQVVMALLERPFNFGVGAEEIRFICIILSPTKGKHTKSGVEVGRTYATLLADDRLRQSLVNCHTPAQFAHEFELEVHRIHKEHEKELRQKAKLDDTLRHESKSSGESPAKEIYKFIPGLEMMKDIQRRSKFYLSDYVEDLRNATSIQKMISATLFLYFSLLLPGIAFGILNQYYTDGKIDSKNVVVSQALAGLLFAIFGGQPLVVVRTTIPVVIYTKIIYIISKNWAEDGSFFYTFYAMTGIANAFFLVTYALTGVSKIMAFCSRSTEEIVGLFISTAFAVDSVKYIVKEFKHYYCFDELNITNSSIEKRAATGVTYDCDPTKPILTLLIIFITVYVGVQIFNFKNSPYLNAIKRVMVADYALVVAVLAGSLVGSLAFKDIAMKKFDVNEERALFQFVQFVNPAPAAVFTSIALGFVMSILFFMEGNISASIVNNPANQLKKGSAFHLDMFVTGIINLILSLFALPWIHGSLPHSPLHVRALADIEEHIDNGHLTEKIVYVRETRLTTLVSHIFIGASVLMIPYPLNMIPIPVFYGLFLFLAITSLEEFQMWERLVLIFTEQNLYPPIHYVRKVPQKIIHCFTFLQLLQLGALCAISFGGSVYLKMFFPFVIIMLMPIRERILPKLISERHLSVLDGLH